MPGFPSVGMQNQMFNPMQFPQMGMGGMPAGMMQGVNGMQPMMGQPFAMDPNAFNQYPNR